MTDHILADLDELALEVRDRSCRTYIQEAIAAYRVRAFRAAVVSTWVAVAYDIIIKTRELASQGNKEAEAFISKFDKAVEAQNLPELQKAENGLLAVSGEKFEFLSKRETEELERLRQDRHLCAHPAFSGSDALFTPSAELVRTHLVHAIAHLLSKPAVHGKAALDRLKSDILQPSFPTDPERTAQYLNAKYLDHAKQPFVGTLVTVLLKVIVRDADKELAAVKPLVCNCLRAVALRHPAPFEAHVRQELPKLVLDADDARHGNLFLLFGADPRIWNWLDEPTKIRLRHIAENPPLVPDLFGPPEPQPTIDPASWLGALDVPELGTFVRDGFNSMESDGQERLLRQNDRPEFNDRAIFLFSRAGGWRHAESLGRGLILPRARTFSPEQVRAVINAVMENDQIWDAVGMQTIMTEFFRSVSQHHEATKKDWKELLEFLEAQDRNWTGIEATAREKGWL